MPNEWQTVLDELKSRATDMAFETYFKNLKFVTNEDGNLVLAVANVFIKTNIEGKYRDLLESALAAGGIEYGTMKIVINDAKNKTTAKRAIEVLPTVTASTSFNTPAPTTPSYNRPVVKIKESKISSTNNGLNPKYRLDNYIVGSNNDLAVSAAKAIIENPGTRYNPYFLYGGSGLGKTHLIQAIGNEILANNPDMKVLYVTIEQFYHEFVEAMRKKLDGFSEKYRNVDVLIVDDFQYIEGKDKSQVEFFHTFNELHQRGKQIIVSSDRLPNQIATVDARLASRLTMGMPIDIQLPDFETRCAIIKAKAEMLNAEIGDNAVEYLAKNIQTNIRELEGKLNQLLLLSEMRGVSPDDLIAEGLIATPQEESKRRSISPKQVVDKVAKYYNLSAKDLYGTSRTKDIKSARQVAMYLMKDQLGLSTVKIGTEFKKDHTTIMHGIKVIETALKTDFNLRSQISDLREKIYAN